MLVSHHTILKIKRGNPIGALIICLVMIIAAMVLPPGIDWRDTYRPATLTLLSGKSPYEVDTFFAAPWALIPMVPLALLPERIGRAILFVVGIITFAFVAHRLGASPISMVAFLLSPPVLHCLLNSNIEWLVLIGLILPPQWGLFFITIKPQIGVAVILFWLIEARRQSDPEIIRVFGPVSLILLISFVLFGLWPTRFSTPLAYHFNASLWPYSLPIGLTLLTTAIRKRKIEYAAGASPCLSPYVLFHSWSGALIALSSSTAEMIMAVIGLWLLVIIRGGM